MNNTLAVNCVRLARNLVELTPHHWKHFSFVCRRTTIHSIGWNQPYKTHPMALQFGYKFNCLHSELHSIVKVDLKPSELRKFTLVNVRLDKDGNVRMSKPCKICQQLLTVFNFDEVWFSNNGGSFEKLY